ncbi:ArsI/CadI family heavy metal resistance metalloenzyme [Thiohalorhabdus methylotrophus]|uniref:ArsI/CadI family heavy metal resistance metalloenzyme n=1 Tax=Thiohalorhabdus methylotrophus TaxID=3242694 RepID=A0ABV4TTI9_9GAMM
MNRFHVHIAVDDLDKNIAFYNALFGTEPAVVKPDYAKWELTDPAVNFAISARGRAAGLDHVGLQAGSEEERAEIEERLQTADIAGVKQEGTTCCYARSDKYWVTDPQGIAWETFHTLGEAPLFGEAEVESGESACCAPRPEDSSSSCCG